MQEPFSRPFEVNALPKDGETVTIEANAKEREALAAFLKLPSIEALTAMLVVRPTAAGGARATGSVRGEVTQTCVVTLEPFPAKVEEEIDVSFAPDAPRRPLEETVSIGEDDGPDPIVDGRIDLGALAAEFLALGLDPYPRKPGVEFQQPLEPEAGATPFAVLKGDRKTPG